jgi:hypothetical protein
MAFIFAALTSPLITTFAAACEKRTFFGLVPWYQYLSISQDAVGRCAITDFDQVKDGVNFVFGTHSAFLLIGLAILQDLVRIAGLVAVGYIIVGGITYMTSQGSPDQTKKAQQTIINALIGLAVAIVAASLVAFIGNKLG